jgi:Flp pilus assembly protein TadG
MRNRTVRTRRTTRPRGRFRAAILLEFIFTLPLTFAMCMFIVDAGRVYIADGALNDAAWRTARTAAVAGSYDQTTAEDVFFRSLAEAPAGVSLQKASSGAPGAAVAVSSGAGVCDATNKVIRVQASASVPTITPGLSYLLGAGGGWNGWSLQVVAVARCEVSN